MTSEWSGSEVPRRSEAAHRQRVHERAGLVTGSHWADTSANTGRHTKLVTAVPSRSFAATQSRVLASGAEAPAAWISGPFARVVATDRSGRLGPPTVSRYVFASATYRPRSSRDTVPAST